MELKKVCGQRFILCDANVVHLYFNHLFTPFSCDFPLILLPKTTFTKLITIIDDSFNFLEKLITTFIIIISRGRNHS